MFGYILPTTLETEKSLSTDPSKTVPSIISFVGMLGSLSSGFIAAQTGRRKPIITVATVLTSASLFAVLSVQDPTIIIAASVLYGLVYMAMYPPQSTLVIETQPDNTLLVAAFAMTGGVGMIAALIMPSLFTAVTEWTGSMTTAMKLMSLALLLAVLFYMFLRETGPKADTRRAAEEGGT